MFNRLLVKILGRFLSYYMNNFSKESFKLEMLQGTFALADIEVNPQFLKETIVLPNLEITKCLCDRIFIKIPWHHIMSEPIIFDLDRVELVCQEIPLGPGGEQASERKERPTTSYAWAQRIIDGIKMNVGEVDMTMHFNGYRGVPYIKKVKCTGISIYSTDSEWKAVDLKDSFVDDKQHSEVLFYKMMDCKSLTVSFARADQPEPEFCTFMRNLPVQIRMKVLRDSKDASVICGDFQLYLPRADMSFSGQQWKNFIELLKGVVGCFTRTDQEYPMYRDVGKDARKKEVPERSKSWWEKMRSTKGEERKEKEKARKIAELEMRHRTVKQLKSIGADASHLEVIPNETHFRVNIEKGSMNLLEEEDRLTEEPFTYAFGRLFFEGMNIDVELPPATDVPDTNKWTANTRQRLLMEAFLNINHMACVIQENFHSYSEDIKKSGPRERKQITILTDNRSEDLNQRVSGVKSDPSAAAEEARPPTSANAAEEERKMAEAKAKRQKDFVHIGWIVRSRAPEETNMERWLMSLDCQMDLDVYSTYFVMLHKWWGRIIRYLETSSLGSDSIEAINLIKMSIDVQVEELYITVPLHGCFKYEVPTTEDLGRLPHVVLTGSRLKAGSNVLQDVTNLFASRKLPLDRFATGGQPVEGWQVCGLGRSSDGWILHTHAHKPQRFQLFLENLMLSVGPDRIMSPTNFGMELTLHRFKTTEQLLLELCTHAELIQIHANRVQYLLYLHFMEYLSAVIWPELELALLRKYGPFSIQDGLTQKPIVEVARENGHAPIAINTHSLIEYLMLHINSSAITESKEDNVTNAFFKLSTKETSAVELHLENLRTDSTNVALFKTGKNFKTVECQKATFMVPACQDDEPRANGKGPEKQDQDHTDIQSSKPLVEVNTLLGKVQTEHLKQLDALLKSNNETAFSELLETNCQSTESDARVTIRQNHLVIDDEHSPATLPRSLTQFLVDFVMAQD
jgi:hypothetical protein